MNEKNNNTTLVSAETERKHDIDIADVEKVATVAGEAEKGLGQLGGHVTTLVNRNSTQQFFKPTTDEAAKINVDVLAETVLKVREVGEQAQKDIELLQSSKIGLKGG